MERLSDHIVNLTRRFPALEGITDKIQNAANHMVSCYRRGGKVLICGNGGSSSDADHIVAELMKGFLSKRSLSDDLKHKLVNTGGERGRHLSEVLQQGLPAISLTAHSSLNSAVANDSDPDIVFAQQVVSYGNPGDILLGISTSGNAKNVVNAAIAAKSVGMTVIGLTGKGGGHLKNFCDIMINVPEEETHLIQELHLPVYHTICMIVEETFFK